MKIKTTELEAEHKFCLQLCCLWVSKKTWLLELEAEAEEYTNHNVRFKALFLIGFSTCASNYDNLYFTGS